MEAAQPQNLRMFRQYVSSMHNLNDVTIFHESGWQEEETIQTIKNLISGLKMALLH